MPWAQACNDYIDKIITVKPFGTLEKYAAATAETKGVDGMEVDVQMKGMQAFHAAVDPAMQKKGLSWAAILGKEEKDYVRHRDKIIKVGKKAVDNYVRATHLTKRRLKAERYEKRHMAELAEEQKKICIDVLGPLSV